MLHPNLRATTSAAFARPIMLRRAPSTTPMVSRSSRVCMGSYLIKLDKLGDWFIKKSLNHSKFVIPAKAGIQKNQRTGHRPSPV
ncbi:hypothetical protein [Nitrosomonas sp.]|uniref:hypothetical protein n=1 Tax=Nitrosomonas sp. TaxID=42353 RepID=UPI00272FCCC3|nr:hypothetical protein [Nitrosomonas sp.]MDP2224453.1 hypothetical protein [Nitrosomonas sp.]